MLFRVLLPLLLTGWLSACCPVSEADRQNAQAANLMLTRTLHSRLNQLDWTGLDSLFAPTVRYRGRLLGEMDVEVLTQYRRMIQTGGSDTLVLRQIYPAGAYHVIVEGIKTSRADTARSVCLIYTIEKQRISRVCAY
jgi:hypothetical protein